MVACFTAYAILTPEAIPPPFFSRRTTSTNKNNSWQLLLKSATFRTLSKYTGFSPSLDVKMEADTLLWEKLEGAKYIKKASKQPEELERIKTGLLIDMTRENGYLEFRQTDRSRYNLDPRDQRLLALWKVQKLDQNHYYIQIKIPQDPPIEDNYEYTLDEGLKEISVKDANNFSKHLKNSAWKANDNKSARSLDQTPSDSATIKRQDHYVIRMQQYNGNRYKLPEPYRFSKATPRTFLYKPTQYYTVVGLQTPPPPPKYPLWRQNEYYPINSYKLYPEFKQDNEYNGFIPSIGPSGNPPLYRGTPVEPVQYKHLGNYYPTYTSPKYTTTNKPYQITYFKPSTQFIQYSESDPFYASNENNTYSSIVTSETPPALSENNGVFPEIVYQSPLPSISIDVPPITPGESLYDSAVSTVKNESEIKEKAVDPTSSATVNDYTQNTKDFNRIRDSQTELTKSTTEKVTSKERSKNNNVRSPHISSLTGLESYDYAPLYIRWGQKLKPLESKIKTTTPRTKEYNPQKLSTKQLSGSRNSATKAKEADKENKQSTSESENKPWISDKKLQKESPSEEGNTTNYVITNITTRTPEEVVNDLTTMGLKNKTITIPENVRDIKTETLTNEPKESHSKGTDNEEEGSEPVSVVVNRISQSYSYKTSVGHIGNLKQLPDKT